jgi:hypothetical protein
MRLLFTTTGQAGHVLPLVPLARACLRAGHEVRVAGPRSRGAIVRDAGLPFWPFADPPEDEVWAVFAPTARLPAEEANAVVIGEVFGRLAAGAALPGLEAMIESWRPDVIVRESYEFASALAAERAGVPHVRVATGLASTEEWMLGYARAAPVSQIRASPLISFTPPALDDGPASHRFRAEVATPGSNRWGEPLVYVTFGSVVAGTPLYPGVYRAALEELAERAAAGQRDRRALGAAGRCGCARGGDGLPRRLRDDRGRAVRRRPARGGAAVRRSGVERRAGGGDRRRARSADGGEHPGRGRDRARRARAARAGRAVVRSCGPRGGGVRAGAAVRRRGAGRACGYRRASPGRVTNCGWVGELVSRPRG